MRLLRSNFLFQACVAMLVALPSGSSAQEAPVEDDLETIQLPVTSAASFVDRLVAIENHLNAVRTMRARFIQQAPDGSLAEGMFYMERPGRMRFEYDGDAPILIVGDGRRLHMVDYEARNVSSWPIKDTPLRLLTSEVISFDDHDVAISAGPGKLANIIAVTATDPKHPDQGTITLVFETGRAGGEGVDDLRLRTWQVLDARGDITTVRLFDAEINLGLEASLWEFDDPRPNRMRRRGRQ